jgi:hypothetical protein
MNFKKSVTNVPGQKCYPGTRLHRATRSGTSTFGKETRHTIVFEDRQASRR